MRLHFGFASLLLAPILPVFASTAEQVPMVGLPKYTLQTTRQPSLADHLTIETSASIFYSYARELEMSKLFSDENARITLLVPTNKAVMALARKPHQGPPLEDGIEISEAEFDQISRKNVERWVSAHIIPEHPISLKEPKYSTMLDGRSVAFNPIKDTVSASPEWRKVAIEDGIRILKMEECSNGVLYIIDGTISVD